VHQTRHLSHTDKKQINAEKEEVKIFLLILFVILAAFIGIMAGLWIRNSYDNTWHRLVDQQIVLRGELLKAAYWSKGEDKTRIQTKILTTDQVLLEDLKKKPFWSTPSNSELRTIEAASIALSNGHDLNTNEY
jgi:hypothetical protein